MRREYLIPLEIALHLMKRRKSQNLLFYTSLRKGEHSYTGTAIRICKNDDMSNYQVWSTYTFVNNRLVQIGYRFRRKTLKNMLPHPMILAG